MSVSLVISAFERQAMNLGERLNLPYVLVAYLSF